MRSYSDGNLSRRQFLKPISVDVGPQLPFDISEESKVVSKNEGGPNPWQIFVITTIAKPPTHLE